MLKNTIDLNQLTWNTAGHVTVTPDNDPARPWICRERDRLLNLVYFVSYTDAGRALLWSEVPAGGKTPAQVRTNLTAKLRVLFPTKKVSDQEPQIQPDEPTLTDAEIDLVIDAHLAAVAYKTAFAAGDQDAMKLAQQQFIVASRFVTDALYEASMGHLISMVW